MPLVGRQYYLVPPVQVRRGGRRVWVPAVDAVCVAAGGAWSICYQDSDTSPAWFVIVVNDRHGPLEARNPAVHTAILASAGAVYLGGTLAAAKAAIATLKGAAHANSPHFFDQLVGGE